MTLTLIMTFVREVSMDNRGGGLVADEFDDLPHVLCTPQYTRVALLFAYSTLLYFAVESMVR